MMLGNSTTSQIAYFKLAINLNQSQCVHKTKVTMQITLLMKVKCIHIFQNRLGGVRFETKFTIQKRGFLVSTVLKSPILIPLMVINGLSFSCDVIGYLKESCYLIRQFGFFQSSILFGWVNDAINSIKILVRFVINRTANSQ